MEPLEKSYFFYKNTPEYKKIENRLDWSIVAILYVCIIHVAIGDDYDFFINVIIAIATGYIISYFYFRLVTYKQYIDREILSVYYIARINIFINNVMNICLYIQDSNVSYKEKEIVVEIGNICRIIKSELESIDILHGYVYRNLFLIHGNIINLHVGLENNPFNINEVNNCMINCKRLIDSIYEKYSDSEEIKQRVNDNYIKLMQQMIKITGTIEQTAPSTRSPDTPLDT
uniref:hypothetical protein n=1 Tax=uncultured Bilophila sp. TaxID=529385 RepID=UPI0025D10A3E|nr:hypothetical protein [uncultured Bilophila sp.]